MQQTANLQQAIELISQIIAQYRGTLQEHQAIQNAFQLLIDKAQEAKIEIKAQEIQEVSSN
jgi:hypothetical protein